MGFSGKHIAVSGGAGFIGKSVIKKLLKEDARITVIDNFAHAPRTNVPPRCRIVLGNTANIDTWNQIEDADYILHFGTASSTIAFNKDPHRYVTETIGSLVNVFEYAKTHNVKKVIYPSSGQVYGDTELPQSETKTVPNPKNLYGTCKLTCEFIAQHYSDIPSVGLRIFAGYGLEEKHKGEICSALTMILRDLMADRAPIIWGDGQQSRDFIYIDDIIKVAIDSMINDFSGVVNVGTGEAHTFNEVIKIVNETLGKNIQPKYVDKPPKYYDHTLADTTRLKEVYNISPTNLQTGLKRYLEELKNA